MFNPEWAHRRHSETPWTPDQFCHEFAFKRDGEFYYKRVRGKKYLFRLALSPDELHEVTLVQRKAWDWEDIDIAPTHILALMGDTGGGIITSYAVTGEMVAFAAGFGGGKDTLTGRPALISSMLAISKSNLRSSGLGKELKILQAYFAYQNGYEVMKWFYDPERGENASLNLRKLGARAEEFYINKYGQMNSGLYGPVPTDRLRAVWRFTEPSIINRLKRISRAPTLDEIRDIPVASIDSLPNAKMVLVQISGNIDLESEEEKIKRRLQLRIILDYYFNKKGYIATEFVSGIKLSNRYNYYILEPLQK